MFGSPNERLVGIPLTSVALATLLAGCAATQNDAAAQGERQVSYSCEGGPDVTLVFRGDTAELARPGEPTLTLQRQTNGEFLYEAAVRSARLSGETLTLITGRMAPNICHQK